MENVSFKTGFPDVETIRSIKYVKIKNHKTHIDYNRLNGVLNSGPIHKMYEYLEKNKPEKAIEMIEGIFSGTIVTFKNLKIRTKSETTLSMCINNKDIISWSSNDICPYTLPFSFYYGIDVYFGDEKSTDQYKVILDYEIGYIELSYLFYFNNVFFDLEKRPNDKTTLLVKNIIAFELGIITDNDIENLRVIEKPTNHSLETVKKYKTFMENEPVQRFSEEEKEQYIKENKKIFVPNRKIDAKTWFELESGPPPERHSCISLRCLIQ